jgi:hypothetical protein
MPENHTNDGIYLGPSLTGGATAWVVDGKTLTIYAHLFAHTVERVEIEQGDGFIRFNDALVQRMKDPDGKVCLVTSDFNLKFTRVSNNVEMSPIDIQRELDKFPNSKF